MWCSPEYLRKCQALRDRGVHFPFETGMRLARGFADLGYEEFVILPVGRLLSLFTGQTSEFPDDHRHFFFAVPTFDQLVQYLIQAGYALEALEFCEQRTWVATVHAREVSVRGEGETPQDALIEVTLKM
jgi:hypothetical protein